MKIVIASAVLALGLTGALQAADVSSRGCMACHAVDKKLVGPSFRDIATKYAGTKNADMKLAKKIRTGGGGVWGPIPMPPHAHISETEAKALAQWVLQVK